MSEWKMPVVTSGRNVSAVSTSKLMIIGCKSRLKTG